MTDGLPQSARELLAKQRVADAHPSADLLNAYSEQALSAAEKDHIAGHLACCDQCREVVFLASRAEQEEEVSVSAAAPVPYVSNVPQKIESSSPQAQRVWWKWVVPALAMVVIASVALVERDRIVALFRPESGQTVAMSRVPASAAAPSDVPAQPESGSAVAEKAVKPNRGSQSASAVQGRRAAAERAKTEAREQQRALQPAQMAAVQEAKPKAATTFNTLAQVQPPASVDQSQAAPPPLHADGEATAPASAMANLMQQQALLKSGFAGSGESAAFPAPQVSTSARRVMQNRAQWRISSDGHLEHATAPDNWTRVLASEPVTFHVVATVAGHVWAGGSNGALFRSSDGGQHWNKVPLNSGGQTERGTISAIQFDSSQQGSLTTDSGATWTTSNGGQSWNKQ